MNRPLIDTETAAYAAGISERRVRQLVQAGELTNYGTRNRIRIDYDQLAATRHL